jgi:hypothetical protein
MKDLNLKELFGFATDEEVATLLGKTAETLANDRCRGVGPRYVKAGKKVLYPLAGLREYFEARTITPEATSTAPSLIHGAKRRGRPAQSKASNGYDVDAST